MNGLAKNMKYQSKKSIKFLIRHMSIFLLLNIAVILFNIFSGNGIAGISLKDKSFLTILNVYLIMIFLLAGYSHNVINDRMLLNFSLNTNRFDFIKIMFLDTILVVLLISILQIIVFKLDPLLGRNMIVLRLFDYSFIETTSTNIMNITFIIFLVNLFYSFLRHLLFILALKYGNKIGFIIIFIVMVISLGIDFFIKKGFNLVDKVNTFFYIKYIIGTIILSILLKYSIENLEI